MSFSTKVAERLVASGKTLALAESCTGGWLASRLVEHPGISRSLLEGAVVYSNEAKERLGVRRETLEAYGAVSPETALELAACVRGRAGADIALATTGIAGPGGGSAQKPVGLVYVAIAFEDTAYCHRCLFTGSRQQIRSASVHHALAMLLSYLNDEPIGGEEGIS